MLGRKRSINSFGAIKPKAIARKISAAVIPSVTVLRSKSGDALPPGAIRSTSPPAIRNRNTPGISDTTEAKPNAANGSRSRSAIGVTRALTTEQATSAPVSTLLSPIQPTDGGPDPKRLTPDWI
jgi:hypothetical protein